MAENSARVMGMTIVKSIVYGSIAKDIKYQKRQDGHTHKWTVYVRPYLDEDMSTWVRKVHFKLHDSYDTPIRIVETSPFEVTETGWGEFELTIKIFFSDLNERPVTLHHFLKLYKDWPGIGTGIGPGAGSGAGPDTGLSAGPDTGLGAGPDTGLGAGPGGNRKVSETVILEPVVSESYEEIIFKDPTQYMSYILHDSMSIDNPVAEQHLHYEDIKKNTLADIIKARKKVQEHTALYRERLLKLKGCINKYNNEICAMESQCCSSSLKK